MAGKAIAASNYARWIGAVIQESFPKQNALVSDRMLNLPQM